MSFKQDLFVPFHLVDAAGVLFYGHIFTLAHQTFERFIVEHLNLSWQSWFNHPEWIVPIKQTQATYYQPILAGLSCSIHLHVQEMRTTSFQVDYQFFQREALCCQAQTVHVFCDRATKKKREIPDSIRDILLTSCHFH